MMPIHNGTDNFRCHLPIKVYNEYNTIILLPSAKGLILPAASCLYSWIIILANDSSLQKQFYLTLLVDTPGLHLLLPGVPDLQWS